MSFLCAILLIIAIGTFFVIKQDNKIKNNIELQGENYKPMTQKGLCIAYAIIIGCIIGGIMCFNNIDTGSSKSKNSGVKSRPWEDLGVSQKEYMDTYKYIKSHGTK